MSTSAQILVKKTRTFSAIVKCNRVEIEAWTEEDAWWEFVDMAGGAGCEHLVKQFMEV